MSSLVKSFSIAMLVLLYVTMITRATMLYLKDGINPFVLGKGKSFFSKTIELIFFVVLLIWSYEVFVTSINSGFHIIPINDLFNIITDIMFLKVIGILLIVIGFSIFIVSLVAFGKSWRVGIDKEKPGTLVTHGIFSFSRNPIFIYLDFYFLGTALIYTNLFFILSAVAVIIGIHYQIIQEERFLTCFYGNEYIAYKNKVRRYL